MTRHANGGRVWSLYGQYHREDGPTFERSDGSKVWMVNGEFLRDDGPAVEDIYGNASRRRYYRQRRLVREELDFLGHPAPGDP